MDGNGSYAGQEGLLCLACALNAFIGLQSASQPHIASLQRHPLGAAFKPHNPSLTCLPQQFPNSRPAPHIAPQVPTCFAWGSRNCTTSACPAATASSRGVLPQRSTAWMAAPELTSMLTISRLPCAAAR